jgi:hypothetical protein
MTARAVLLGAAALLVGCDDGGHATIDSLPIALARAPMGFPAGEAAGISPDGALLLQAGLPGVPEGFEMLLDTSTPTTLFAGRGSGRENELTSFVGSWDLREESIQDGMNVEAVRARFRDYDLLSLPLHPVGAESTVPSAVLGGDIMRGFSIDLRFGAACGPENQERCASVTFWRHQNADLGILQDAGFAVLGFSLTGGGEVTAQGNEDFLGLRGPISLPATRVLLRGCLGAALFAPTDDIVACCERRDASTLATGANLALLLATGVGPTILGEAAWARVVAAGAATGQTFPEPVAVPASLRIATWPTPLDARWTTLPRLALVDQEVDNDNDPGACVELARARRLEQVSYRTVHTPEANTCFQPCDADVRERGKAQNSAAYLEIGGQIPVAIIAETEPFLQGLRFDIRAEGPELDGLIGAGALGRSRVEIDYVSDQTRALFSCETDASRAECRAVPRCPRLPTGGAAHVCFGLPRHGQAETCDTSLCQ